MTPIPTMHDLRDELVLLTTELAKEAPIGRYSGGEIAIMRMKLEAVEAILTKMEARDAQGT